jgi:hypothetical protein
LDRAFIWFNLTQQHLGVVFSDTIPAQQTQLVAALYRQIKIPCTMDFPSKDFGQVKCSSIFRRRPAIKRHRCLGVPDLAARFFPARNPVKPAHGLVPSGGQKCPQQPNGLGLDRFSLWRCWSSSQICRAILQTHQTPALHSTTVNPKGRGGSARKTHGRGIKTNAARVVFANSLSSQAIASIQMVRRLIQQHQLRRFQPSLSPTLPDGVAPPDAKHHRQEF